MRERGLEVVEVNRPNRQHRRRFGKHDTADAESAARAVQANAATGEPNAADGTVEMVRVLRVARRSAVKARTQAANQLRALFVTAPEELKAELRGLSTARLVATAARFSRADCGWGHPESLESEAAFARLLCGVAPVPASSGKTKREILRCLKRYVAREVYRVLTTAGMCRIFLRRSLDTHRSIVGNGGARRVLEGRLAGSLVAGGAGIDARRLVFVDECGAKTSRFRRCWRGLEARGAGAREGAAQLWANVTLLSSMSTERGDGGPSLAVEGATTRRMFEAYLEGVLAPTPSRGR